MNNSLRLLAQFCAILFLYAVPHTAQSAPILYNFVITDIVSSGSPIQVVPPFIGGTLFLDASAVARGSVFYSELISNLENHLSLSGIPIFRSLLA